ncbi:protein ESMERALDA 1 [Tanacetum coccineum]
MARLVLQEMVALSCCVYDGGSKEREDMIAARERGLKGKFTKPGRVIKPGANRVNEKCPLTPLEVGLMLRGMGFDKTTFIFLASGRIYDSERHMDPLLEMFPVLQTKGMLASPEELASFMNYSSRMAAIDYTVCLHSEVLKLIMIRLFQAMGEVIVRQESYKDVEKRSRVIGNDSYEILCKGKGSETIKGLALEMRLQRDEKGKEKAHDDSSRLILCSSST